MKRVLINFPPTYLDDVNQIAAEMGLSLPELVRIAVSHWSVCEDGETSTRQKIAARTLGERLHKASVAVSHMPRIREADKETPNE